MRLFGLIGFPLTHSFSQIFFTEKFRREGIQDCIYRLFPLPSLAGLSQVILKTPDLSGLNVTIPYKKEIMLLLDDRSAIPPGLDACNCIRLDHHKMTGFNTDVTGFEKSLLPILQPWHKAALILGTGGAASSVSFVLQQLQIPYRKVSRTPVHPDTLSYTEINEEIIREHQLIINTTPLGMFPHIQQYPDLPYEHISSKHLLFDLLYNPAQTAFLEKGLEKGAAIKNGEEMFVVQAEESWKIWNL